MRVSHRTPLFTLALSKQAMAQSFRRLIIAGSDFELADFPQRWADVLTSSTVGRFSNFKGLRFYLWTYYFDTFMSATDVMSDSEWGWTKLPQIIRAFQQHKLNPSINTVNYVSSGHLSGGESEWGTKLNESIRDELLNHHPRRLSRRGKGEDRVLS